MLFLTRLLLYPPDPDGLALSQAALQLANILTSLLQIVIVIGLGYYYLLLAACFLRHTTVRTTASPDKSFAIAIPAHNEQAVLAKTIGLLRSQTYPPDLFDIYVAADHCNDHTAEVAVRNGAICYERSEEPRGRKAYALQWLLARILAGGKVYDAFVIFDADSQVDSGFLESMNRALGPDRPVLQGKHVIANPEESRFSRLAAVDMRLNNLLRNQAKQTLGLSCRLMGDAMCFAADVIRQHGWLAGSLVEDREYGLHLLTQEIRISYLPEAVSSGQAAPGWNAAASQRLRWYGGVFHIRKKFASKLLKQALQRCDEAALDQAIELLLPPFSVLTLLSLCLAVVQWMWPVLHPLFPAPVSTAIAVAWIVFPFVGLWIDHAPWSAYRALVHSPFYLIWRLWLGFQARVRREKIQWIRTRRREENTTQIPEV
jgi:cellulose synthase/poly-beta-1,6-N-acetylglucosamine synthase-like glycosyltransferase